MRNFGLPEDPAAFRRDMPQIAQALRDGDAVLLHCAAGMGRTGSAAACVLKALGLDTRGGACSGCATPDRTRRTRSSRDWWTGSSPRLSGAKRIGENEHHRHADADQEVRVDQAGQQEHLRLQRFHQFGLAHRAVDEAPAHGAYAQAGADGAQADDQAAREGNQAGVAHGTPL